MNWTTELRIEALIRSYNLFNHNQYRKVIPIKTNSIPGIEKYQSATLSVENSQRLPRTMKKVLMILRLRKLRQYGTRKSTIQVLSMTLERYLRNLSLLQKYLEDSAYRTTPSVTVKGEIRLGLTARTGTIFT